MGLHNWLLGLFFLLITVTGAYAVEQILDDLNAKTASYIVRKEVSTYTPPFGWRKIKGLYSSWFHIYAHGDIIAKTLRDGFKIYDNNGFATMWIANQLVEAAVYGGYEGTDPNDILMNVEALDGFRDRNFPNGSSLATFWKQQDYNKTSGLWMCNAKNMHDGLTYALKKIPFKQLEWMFNNIGLNKVTKNLEKIKKLFSLYTHTTHLPADFDDSSVMLGLGLLLQKSRFTKAAQAWKERNKNATYLMKMLKKYAYRPFGKDNDTNVIDPRTYFYARHVLEKAMITKQPLVLVTTWAQTVGENLVQRPSVSSPMNMNTMDCTVGANMMYAVSSALMAPLDDPKVWFDDDLKMLYLNTSELITWAVTNKVIEKRPDISLVYYPSQYLFHWFLSRTMFLLNSEPQLKLPELKTVRDKMIAARPSVTSWFMRQAQRDNSISGMDLVYFDDFLGNGDTLFGKPFKYGEVRLATTGLALNALLNYWTWFNATDKRIYWIKETPEDVKSMMTEAKQWLKLNILAGKLDDMNMFFSGAIRGNSSDPRFYPINYFLYMNGTEVPGNATGSLNSMALGWRGVVPEAKYQQWITEWQQKTQVKIDVDFPGYNVETRNWRFWTAPAFTYSNALLALSKFAKLIN